MYFKNQETADSLLEKFKKWNHNPSPRIDEEELDSIERNKRRMPIEFDDVGPQHKREAAEDLRQESFNELNILEIERQKKLDQQKNDAKKSKKKSKKPKTEESSNSDQDLESVN